MAWLHGKFDEMSKWDMRQGSGNFMQTLSQQNQRRGIAYKVPTQDILYELNYFLNDPDFCTICNILFSMIFNDGVTVTIGNKPIDQSFKIFLDEHWIPSLRRMKEMEILFGFVIVTFEPCEFGDFVPRVPDLNSVEIEYVTQGRRSMINVRDKIANGYNSAGLSESRRSRKFIVFQTRDLLCSNGGQAMIPNPIREIMRRDFQLDMLRLKDNEARQRLANPTIWFGYNSKNWESKQRTDSSVLSISQMDTERLDDMIRTDESMNMIFSLAVQNLKDNTDIEDPSMRQRSRREADALRAFPTNANLIEAPQPIPNPELLVAERELQERKFFIMNFPRSAVSAEARVASNSDENSHVLETTLQKWRHDIGTWMHRLFSLAYADSVVDNVVFRALNRPRIADLEDVVFQEMEEAVKIQIKFLGVPSITGAMISEFYQLGFLNFDGVKEIISRRYHLSESYFNKIEPSKGIGETIAEQHSSTSDKKEKISENNDKTTSNTREAAKEKEETKNKNIDKKQTNEKGSREPLKEAFSSDDERVSKDDTSKESLENSSKKDPETVIYAGSENSDADPTKRKSDRKDPSKENLEKKNAKKKESASSSFNKQRKRTALESNESSDNGDTESVSGSDTQRSRRKRRKRKSDSRSKQ